MNMDNSVMCLWKNSFGSHHTKVEQTIFYGCDKFMPFLFEIFYLMFYYMIFFINIGLEGFSCNSHYIS
jgi:hypothetical protein